MAARSAALRCRPGIVTNSEVGTVPALRCTVPRKCAARRTASGTHRVRILIVAVRRMKSGPERELAERYQKRAAQAGRSLGLKDFDIVEIRESRADDAARRMLEESIAIANVIPERAVMVLLDERG